MPRKPKPPPDNPEQFKRFAEAAREIGTEADPETFDRVLNKVARSSKGHRQLREKLPPDKRAASRSRRKG